MSHSPMRGLVSLCRAPVGRCGDGGEVQAEIGSRLSRIALVVGLAVMKMTPVPSALC